MKIALVIYLVFSIICIAWGILSGIKVYRTPGQCHKFEWYHEICVGILIPICLPIVLVFSPILFIIRIINLVKSKQKPFFK